MVGLTCAGVAAEALAGREAQPVVVVMRPRARVAIARMVAVTQLFFIGKEGLWLGDDNSLPTGFTEGKPEASG